MRVFSEARAQDENATPQGRVLGASTMASQASASALDKSIATLKAIADQLADTVAQLRSELGNKQVIVSYSGLASVTPVSTQTFAQGQKIDQLSNTVIQNPTITGGSISRRWSSRRRALPLLGIHILLGESSPQKTRNAARKIEEGRTYPVQVLCRKPL